MGKGNINSWVYNLEKNVNVGEQKLHRCCRKDFGPLTIKLFFFKISTEGDKIRDADSLFHCFKTRRESASLLRRRRLGPCSNLWVCPLSPSRGGGGRNQTVLVNSGASVFQLGVELTKPFFQGT